MKSQDKYLSECFSKPMLTAYRRQPNLRNILVKSRIPPPPNPYPKRDLKGMKKCGLACTACPYIIEGKSVKIDRKNSWNIEKHVSCKSFNIIYLLECQKCRFESNCYWAMQVQFRRLQKRTRKVFHKKIWHIQQWNKQRMVREGRLLYWYTLWINKLFFSSV